MPWTHRAWTSRGSKHISRKRSSLGEAKTLSLVRVRGGQRVSRYVLHPDEVEQLELAATAGEGTLIRESESVRYFYRDCGFIVGASKGTETSFVKVEWHSAGTVHGYPIAFDELLEQLRAHNTDEYERLLQRERE